MGTPFFWYRWPGMTVWVLALSLCPMASHADVITTAKGEIECRVLENSVQVLVAETIAGEYVVIGKKLVQSLQTEPAEEFFYRRGRYYELNGDDNQALLDYLEVLNINPNHGRAKEGIEAIQYRQKKSRWDAKIEEAQTLASKQSYKQALTAYQEVLEMQPDERLAQDIVRRMSETHTQLAYLYYNHCLDQDAIIELAKAEELNPDSSEIYYILGRIHETKRKYTIARLEYERALELNPNHSGARTQLMSLIDRTRGRLFR